MPEPIHFYEPRHGHGLRHDPFNAIVAPRPIGWISTCNAAGGTNLAPYSFFNAFNYVPPLIGFSSLGRKDTVRNIEQTRVFAWNLVTRQLAGSPYMAGERFTAADISVTYALQLAHRAGGVTLGEAESAYVARTSARDAYRRAMDSCHATRAWAARARGAPLKGAASKWPLCRSLLAPDIAGRQQAPDREDAYGGCVVCAMTI